MAYNKVGTPRFYIDYLSYWQSIGMVHNLVAGIGANIIDGSYIGLDPSKLCNFAIEDNTASAGQSALEIDFSMPTGTFIDQGTLENINYGGIIGHNLNKPIDDGVHTSIEGGAAVRFSLRQRWGDDLPPSSQSWRGALSQQLVPINERNIINSTYTSNDSRTFLDDSGFSLFGLAVASQSNDVPANNTVDPETGEYLSEVDGGVPWDLSIHGANVDRIALNLRFWDETAAEGAGDWLVDTSVGYSGSWAANSIVLGHYYDMPHSPELDLSMTIENDGVDIFTTTGGSHISNIKYNGAPMWEMDDGTSIPPWTIGEPTTSGIRRGRRVWDLKFSYLSDKDLFASNPMRGTYMEDDTNIDPEDIDILNWNVNSLLDGEFTEDVPLGSGTNSARSGTYWYIKRGTFIDNGVVEFGSNLLSNGGFETVGSGGGADIWENWTETAGSGVLANETTIVNSGDDAAKLTTSSGNQANITQAFTGVTDRLYRLSFYTRGDGSSGQTRVKVYDSAGNAPIAEQDTEVTGTDFTYKTYRFTALIDGTITIQFLSGDDNGSSYVDDVLVRQVGNLSASGGEETYIKTRTIAENIVAENTYRLTYTVKSYTSGTIKAGIDGAETISSSEMSEAGTKQIVFTAVGNGKLKFYTEDDASDYAFVGTIDHVNLQAMSPQEDFYYNITTDESFQSRVLNYIGNGERFIFQPDNTSSNPSDFAICQLDQDSLQVNQVANGVYDINLKIREVW